MKNKSILVLPLMALFLSCSNNSPDDLIPVQPTIDLVSYNDDIKAIIDANCLECHGTTPQFGAPMSLTNYQEVKDAMQNRPLLNRISRAQGAEGMMPWGGTRLPQATIDKIAKWQTDGFQQ
jgi:mono/diheme cytochrome c family protein